LIVSSAVGRTQNQPAASGTQTMMASQQKMMAAMQANEKKLDDLVARAARISTRTGRAAGSL
jgi:diadenosine tetraphosphate (Ap4A) HIT family hydrolase